MSCKEWLANIAKLLSRFTQELAPFGHYLFYKRKRLREANSKTPPGIAQKYEKLSEKELTTRLQEERQRGAAMDEKTFKMTLSLSFGLTVVGTLSPLLLERIHIQNLRTVCGAAIAFSVFYALTGGFVALGAMRTLPTYGFGTLLVPKSKRKRDFAQALARNELIGIVRHLRNETAYMALRNGFLFLSVALGTFLYAWVAAGVAPFDSD